MSETKTIAERPETVIRKFFESNMQKISDVLPEHLKKDGGKRFLMIALNAIWQNPDLMKCDPFSLFKSVLEAAELGLEVGSFRGQAYIIPYGNKAQLQVGYLGLIDLASRSKEVEDVRARVVYDKDEFMVEYGLEEKLIHRPYIGDDKGKPTHTYAVIRYKDGGRAFEVMSMEDIEKVKTKSRTAKMPSSSWVQFPEEMIKKTVLRRLLKTIPKEIEKVKEVIGQDEEIEFGKIDNSTRGLVQAATEARTEELKDKLTDMAEASTDTAELEEDEIKDPKKGSQNRLL